MPAAAAPAPARLASLLFAVLLFSACNAEEFVFRAPAPGQLSAPGDVEIELVIPAGADPTTLTLLLDGQPVPSDQWYFFDEETVAGLLPGLAAGPHELTASFRGKVAKTDFHLVALDNPSECEILNQVECVLPFPSSRFEKPAVSYTGVQIQYGPNTLPVVNRLTPPFTRGPIDSSLYEKNDGFSPTAQVLMHFPATPDLAASGANVIEAATRTYTERGTEEDSPTLLIDWETGERVLHWVENDATATDPSRVLTFLRPGRSLDPGRRYIVAVRRLVDQGGAPLEPEPVFKAIRDGAPTDLLPVQERADQMKGLFDRLDDFEIPIDELILAFDFQVQSDESLTYEMLAMRDKAFEWLEGQRELGVQTFQVDSMNERNPGCTDPNEPVWREIRGTFQVPLFLTKDPILQNTELSVLMQDAEGEPIFTTTMGAPFGIGIPCDVFDAEGDFHPLTPIVIGHGLFGEGPGTAISVAGTGLVPGMAPGGTNWAGLSRPDTQPQLPLSFIFKVNADPDQIEALADRLRQGQANAQLLAKMMHEGDFNQDPAFQGPGGEGAIQAGEEIYYWGASLGGIMGHMFSALTPHVERHVLDVPAINFSLLLHRATPFVTFEGLQTLLSPDRMDQSIGIGLTHELWVRGEAAGYATHITSDPLPGSMPKKILLHVALHDQQVVNLGSQLAGATLRLPVHESSSMQDLAGMSSSTGPQESAYMVIDTAAFDLNDPTHLPFVPPLINDQAEGNRCDPHNRLRVTPAALDQINLFFQPEGLIQTTCDDDGVCNASAAEEFPNGIAVPCDPFG